MSASWTARGMRVFLSFSFKDQRLAKAIRAGLLRLAPTLDIFFSPSSLGPGFWMPKLAEEVAAADAFLLLIGPAGLGPWQEVEYIEAFSRHVSDRAFPQVPVIAASANAPGLRFLRTLNWITAPDVAEDATLHRLLAALEGENVETAAPLWTLVNPYRSLEALTEANADYFYGREAETGAVLRALAEKPGRCPMLIGASGVGKSSLPRHPEEPAKRASRRTHNRPACFETRPCRALLSMTPIGFPVSGQALSRNEGLHGNDSYSAFLCRAASRSYSWKTARATFCSRSRSIAAATT